MSLTSVHGKLCASAPCSIFYAGSLHTAWGEALVMGYDEMGYELWKPYLRAMMECDMKAVSIGTKRKSEVLESCLQQMKACFLDARRNKVKLLEAMGLFFERSAGDAHNVGETVRPCSLCSESDMVLKRRLNGDYMVGCLRFPNTLPNQDISNSWKYVSQIFRSLTELHPLQSAEPGLIDLEWTFILHIGPVYKVQFKFRRLEIPPNYDVDHLGCIGGCDVILRELIEICGTGSHNHTGMSARGQRGTEPLSSASRGNSRQEPCLHCGQTGHSSNHCPSRDSSCPRAAQPARVRNARIISGEVQCNSCGATCALRTANTESNRGRKFYTCQSQECGFFVWADSLEDGGTRGHGGARGGNGRSSSTARRSGRARGRRDAPTNGVTFVSATGEPVSGSCFVCGDPSHFANACPNRGR
ncbi:hypothetical protein C4D60_Mb06t02940 [Musa balbisiana]|uniref:DNA topoisomerase n=1 Tax=Musa balbisiana TaxID=52838 RepID=A0A4S8IMN1_MUSBA|nr:hypothetical protein C4D60_Mb06t02940 [Musa balbisiana]